MSASKTERVAQVEDAVETNAAPKTERVVQVEDAVETKAAPPPSHVLLSLGGDDESFADDDALLPLFDSIVGQIFWKNCERVWVNAVSARSSVVVSAFKFAEIVSN
jgi:hypothetical protein